MFTLLSMIHFVDLHRKQQKTIKGFHLAFTNSTLHQNRYCLRDKGRKLFLTFKVRSFSKKKDRHKSFDIQEVLINASCKNKALMFNINTGNLFDVVVLPCYYIFRGGLQIEMTCFEIQVQRIYRQLAVLSVNENSLFLGPHWATVKLIYFNVFVISTQLSSESYFWGFLVRYVTFV